MVASLEDFNDRATAGRMKILVGIKNVNCSIYTLNIEEQTQNLDSTLDLYESVLRNHSCSEVSKHISGLAHHFSISASGRGLLVNPKNKTVTNDEAGQRPLLVRSKILV